MVQIDEIEGRSVAPDAPTWEPLLRIVDEDVAEWFMYMFGVVTSDGRRLHAYKHIATRLYVHLDDDGNAFYFVPEHRYRPVDLWRQLEAVLSPWWEVPLADGDERAVAAARRAVRLARARAG